MPVKGQSTKSNVVNDPFQAVLDNRTGVKVVQLALVAGTNYHYYFYLPTTTSLNAVFKGFQLLGDMSTTTAVLETFDYAVDPGGTAIISSGVITGINLQTKYRSSSGGGLSVTAGFAGATGALEVARLYPVAERNLSLLMTDTVGIRAFRGLHIVMNTTGTFNGQFTCRFQEST